MADVGLLAYGGTIFAPRARIGVWPPINEVYLQEYYGIRNGERSYGVGQLKDLRFLILREQQKHKERFYPYTLIIVPGEQVWKTFEHNAAALIDAIIASRNDDTSPNDFGVRLWKAPDDIKPDEFDQWIAALHPSASAVEAGPKEKIAGSLFISRFERESLVVSLEQLGMNERPKPAELAPILKSLPNEFQSDTWLIGGGPSLAAACGASLVLDDVDTDNSRGSGPKVQEGVQIWRAWQALEKNHRDDFSAVKATSGRTPANRKDGQTLVAIAQSLNLVFPDPTFVPANLTNLLGGKFDGMIFAALTRNGVSGDVDWNKVVASARSNHRLLPPKVASVLKSFSNPDAELSKHGIQWNELAQVLGKSDFIDLAKNMLKASGASISSVEKALSYGEAGKDYTKELLQYAIEIRSGTKSLSELKAFIQTLPEPNKKELRRIAEQEAAKNLEKLASASDPEVENILIEDYVKLATGSDIEPFAKLPSQELLHQLAQKILEIKESARPKEKMLDALFSTDPIYDLLLPDIRQKVAAQAPTGYINVRQTIDLYLAGDSSVQPCRNSNALALQHGRQYLLRKLSSPRADVDHHPDQRRFEQWKELFQGEDGSEAFNKLRQFNPRFLTLEKIILHMRSLQPAVTHVLRNSEAHQTRRHEETTRLLPVALSLEETGGKVSSIPPDQQPYTAIPVDVWASEELRTVIGGLLFDMTKEPTVALKQFCESCSKDTEKRKDIKAVLKTKLESSMDGNPPVARALLGSVSKVPCLFAVFTSVVRDTWKGTPGKRQQLMPYLEPILKDSSKPIETLAELGFAKEDQEMAEDLLMRAAVRHIESGWPLADLHNHSLYSGLQAKIEPKTRTAALERFEHRNESVEEYLVFGDPQLNGLSAGKREALARAVLNRLKSQNTGNQADRLADMLDRLLALDGLTNDTRQEAIAEAARRRPSSYWAAVQAMDKLLQGDCNVSMPKDLLDEDTGRIFGLVLERCKDNNNGKAPNLKELNDWLTSQTARRLPTTAALVKLQPNFAVDAPRMPQWLEALKELAPETYEDESARLLETLISRKDSDSHSWNLSAFSDASLEAAARETLQRTATRFFKDKGQATQKSFFLACLDQRPNVLESILDKLLGRESGPQDDTNWALLRTWSKGYRDFQLNEVCEAIFAYLSQIKLPDDASDTNLDRSRELVHLLLMKKEKNVDGTQNPDARTARGERGFLSHAWATAKGLLFAPKERISYRGDPAILFEQLLVEAIEPDGASKNKPKGRWYALAAIDYAKSGVDAPPTEDVVSDGPESQQEGPKDLLRWYAHHKGISLSDIGVHLSKCAEAIGKRHIVPID